MKPSDFPMAKSLFDDDGIYASNPFLKSIAMECIESDRRARACRRAANDLIDDGGGVDLVLIEQVDGSVLIGDAVVMGAAVGLEHG